MYYKKFSQKEVELLRQSIYETSKMMDLLSLEDDKYKKDLKIMEKIQKKLVHVYYLDRGNK
tara:strand:+ start:1065 stop:1247 length:183 start_codon:yes stop_codon:yes gene_type:complete